MQGKELTNSNGVLSQDRALEEKYLKHLSRLPLLGSDQTHSKTELNGAYNEEDEKGGKWRR